MKIAYLLSLNLLKYGGITKKVLAQVEHWQKTGATVQLFCITPSLAGKELLESNCVPVQFFVEGSKRNVLLEMGKNFLNIRSVYGELTQSIKAFDPAVIYFRNAYYQPHIEKLFRLFPTVAEINTNEWTEYKMLSKESFKYKVAYAYYSFTSKKTFNLIQGACLVTYEMQESLQRYLGAIPFQTEVVPNSINIYKTEKRKKAAPSSTVPKLVFIGTPGMPWHGVDKIVELASQTINELEFHIIGFYKADYPEASDNIHFYGILPKGRYEEVVTSCDIGLGTMALYRKQMEEACPLKVREYLASGLPVIIAYEETPFVKEAYPSWILKLPNDSDKLSKCKEKIVSFCNEMKAKVLTQSEVEKFVDVSSLEARRISFLKKIGNQEL